mmetsp:Transcript_18642/g.43115  ORF Transcript_18642/g.43115 Transcript_18642/m.43115 type:complete len:98 (-) Transcript_18642:1641-1934(-)
MNGNRLLPYRFGYCNKFYVINVRSYSIVQEILFSIREAVHHIHRRSLEMKFDPTTILSNFCWTERKGKFKNSVRNLTAAFDQLLLLFWSTLFDSIWK